MKPTYAELESLILELGTDVDLYSLMDEDMQRIYTMVDRILEEEAPKINMQINVNK